jgi:hypothetical protein
MSARAKKPTSKGPPPPPRQSAQHSSQVSDDAKTNIYDSGNFKKEIATPIKAISMKTPGVGMAKPPGEDADTRPKPKVKMRPMSEVLQSSPVAQDLGRLAPPRDAGAARVRKFQDYVLWGSVSVILASVIALIIWFVAR